MERDMKKRREIKPKERNINKVNKYGEEIK